VLRPLVDGAHAAAAYVIPGPQLKTPPAASALSSRAAAAAAPTAARPPSATLRLQSLFNAFVRSDVEASPASGGGGGGSADADASVGAPAVAAVPPKRVQSPFLTKDRATAVGSGGGGKLGSGGSGGLPVGRGTSPKVSLLDARSAQRVGVALTRYFKRVAPAAVVRSLLALDPTVVSTPAPMAGTATGATPAGSGPATPPSFSVDQLLCLKESLLPTDSDVAALKSYTGPPTALGEVGGGCCYAVQTALGTRVLNEAPPPVSRSIARLCPHDCRRKPS
jgi:hypothetical protein